MTSFQVADYQDGRKFCAPQQYLVVVSYEYGIHLKTWDAFLRQEPSVFSASASMGNFCE
jgi:hypothetical protein